MIADIDDLKQHLNIDHDFDTQELTLLLEGAQDHIESLLGFKIEDRFGGTGQKPVPFALAVAVCQLAAHWYQNRETVAVGSAPYDLPLTVNDIIREHREWSW